MSNIKYRKDIDGLRALAVMSVVLFHLNISWFKSGFLGVDIFFVISGYLITTIIIRDLKDGSFSIKNFYLRRMRRILPALIVVIIFTTFLAWLILLPQELRNYSKSAVSALGSFSNLFFYDTLDFSYFGSDASVIPLLHTWSLGIEEQFYIFWPLFLIFAFNVYIGLGWKDKTSLTAFDKLLFGCASLIVISIFYFYWKDSPKYYYFPVSRAFELLFGCILAIVSSNKSYKWQHTESLLASIVFNILSVIALILMLIPILFVNVKYPDVWTIIACMGATLFILSGSNRNNVPVINKIISFKPFVAIGLISYSLYLWHWPIIAYVNYLSIDKTALVTSIILTASFILATLSYFFIEKPFRHKLKFSFAKSLIILWITPIIIACCFALCTKYITAFGFNQYVDKFKVIGKVGYAVQVETEYNDPIKNFKYTNCWHDNGTEVIDNISKEAILKCTKDKKFDVVLFGDSHAMAATKMVAVWADNAEQTMVNIGRAQPDMLHNVYEKNLKSSVQNVIDTTHPKIFVIAGWWSAYSAHSLKYVGEIVEILKENNIKPIILLDWPQLFAIQPTCGMTKMDKIIGMECGNSLQKVLNDHKESLAYLYKLKAKYPEIELVDTTKVLCTDGLCKNTINGKIAYLDNLDMGLELPRNGHLNDYGSTMVGELYMKKYGNPITRALDE